MTREEELRAEYESKLQELREEQSNCSHDWGNQQFKVIY